MLTQNQQKFLLNLARKAIENYIQTQKTIEINEKELDEELKKDLGVFVTLTKNGNLRGCIGHLFPVQKLYKDVIENAINAAFNDRRFAPLLEEELDQIKIEISVLSKPKELEYTDPKDLINKLEANKHGVILADNFHQATYLPQVWQQIPSKEVFLSSLCQKAGLNPTIWQTKKLKIHTYTVESFQE